MKSRIRPDRCYEIQPTPEELSNSFKKARITLEDLEKIVKNPVNSAVTMTTVCPICGEIVTDLKSHLETAHFSYAHFSYFQKENKNFFPFGVYGRRESIYWE